MYAPAVCVEDHINGSQHVWGRFIPPCLEQWTFRCLLHPDPPLPASLLLLAVLCGPLSNNW